MLESYNSPKLITVSYAIREAVDVLKMHSIASPFLDARILLSYVSNYNKNEILLKDNELLLTENQYEIFKKLILERAIEKKPIAKLINHKEFFGLDFYVDENVLDPRPDSEIIVEMILSDYKNIENLNLLEIGTGSSCLIVALVKALSNARATAIDISTKALQIADKNISQHQLSTKIKLLQSDLFDNLATNNKFNIILSNPPYIPSNEIELLDKEVQNYDPISALDGGNDGLDFYRSISKNARNYLHKNGSLYLEIGINQFTAIKVIFENEGWHFEKYQKDLAGIIRALKFKINI